MSVVDLRPNSGERGGGGVDFMPAPPKAPAGSHTGGGAAMLKEPAITIKPAQDKNSKAKAKVYIMITLQEVRLMLWYCVIVILWYRCSSYTS